MRTSHYVIGAAAALAVLGAADAGAQTMAKGGFVDGQGKALGSAEFADAGGNVVVVRLQLSGVPQGWHGLHLHAVGKCDGPDFASAGGHFNPGARKHGHRVGEGAHAGDLPNVFVGADGKITAEVLAHGVSLGGGANSLFDADGSAIVVHAAEDDHKTDPTGNSGARIACAIVTR
jgi:Cu-Zn family superoxide dismutase